MDLRFNRDIKPGEPIVLAPEPVTWIRAGAAGIESEYADKLSKATGKAVAIMRVEDGESRVHKADLEMAVENLKERFPTSTQYVLARQEDMGTVMPIAIKLDIGVAHVGEESLAIKDIMVGGQIREAEFSQTPGQARRFAALKFNEIDKKAAVDKALLPHSVGDWGEDIKPNIKVGDPYPDAKYEGPIVAAGESHFVQQIGSNDMVVHKLYKMDQTRAVEDVGQIKSLVGQPTTATIQYEKGRGKVQELRLQRDRSMQKGIER